MPASPRLRLWQFFLPAAALFLASCAAPLGPGYSIKKQSLEVRYLPGDPPRLEIRARYRLKNTGNRSLSVLDVGLPGEKDYGRKNLRATLDGAEIAPSALSKGSAEENGARISFPRPWTQKKQHDLAIEYQLTAPLAPNMGIMMAGDSLFLSSFGWSPVLRSPEGLFGKGGGSQKPLELAIRVPQGFLAHSSGRARGIRKENSELVYRFQITKDDFGPFVVAGRYSEQRFRNADATILSWTLNAPLPQEQLDRAGAHLASTLKEFESSFGPLSKKPQPYWVVQAHWSFPDAGTPHAGTNVIALPGGNFPGGALYGAEISAPDIGLPLRSIEFQLAGSWFQQSASPRAVANPVLPWALGQYAVDAAEGKAQGDDTDRHSRIREAIQVFEVHRGKGKEKNLLSTAANDPVEQLSLAFIKAGLLLEALQDKCGQDNLQRVLRHLVQSFRGSAYGYNELRSALEQECHQDLGPMFRQWLTETGIPADFRERYERKP